MAVDLGVEPDLGADVVVGDKAEFSRLILLNLIHQSKKLMLSKPNPRNYKTFSSVSTTDSTNWRNKKTGTRP